MVPSGLSLLSMCTSYISCVQVTSITKHLKLAAAKMTDENEANPGKWKR